MSEEKTLTLKSLKKETDESIKRINADLQMMKGNIESVTSAISSVAESTMKSMGYSKSSDLRNMSRITALEARIKRAEDGMKMNHVQCEDISDVDKRARIATILSVVAIAFSAVAMFVTTLYAFAGGV